MHGGPPGAIMGTGGERKKSLVQEEDSLRLLDSFDAAWNAHYEDGVLDLIADDAVARLVPAPPGSRRPTKARIRQKALCGGTCKASTSRDHQAADTRNG
jgi:hypothetical protein